MPSAFASALARNSAPSWSTIIFLAVPVVPLVCMQVAFMVAPRFRFSSNATHLSHSRALFAMRYYSPSSRLRFDGVKILTWNDGTHLASTSRFCGWLPSSIHQRIVGASDPYFEFIVCRILKYPLIDFAIDGNFCLPRVFRCPCCQRTSRNPANLAPGESECLLLANRSRQL